MPAYYFNYIRNKLYKDAVQQILINDIQIRFQ